MKEYKVLKLEVAGIRGHRVATETEDVLNELAQEGWSLVAVVPIVGTRMSFVSSTIAFIYHFERTK